MGIFFEGRPKFTMNVVVLVVSIFQGIMLLSTGMFSGENISQFFQTGMPNPSVCGPLFLTWVVVCALYWGKIVKSPKLSTIIAAVFVYFGTMTLVGQFFLGMDLGEPLMYVWATSVHVMEACIGYGYFIESIISKYKLW